MRTILLAMLLFTAGYGAVTIGQQAGAYGIGKQVFDMISRQTRVLGRQAPGLVRQPSEPGIPKQAPGIEKQATFSDYLDAVNRAFAEMDRSCSEADRLRLGQAFYNFVVYTKGLAGQTPVTGKGSVPADLPPKLSELDIYTQVIDATRRGVLRSRHFRSNAGTLPEQPAAHRREDGERPVSAKHLRPSRSATTEIVSADQIRLTRCPPATL